MSGFKERESRRKIGVVASMISTSAKSKEENNDGRGRPKLQREIKKRISLTVLPSVYNDMQKIAEVQNSNISKIVSEFFEQYIRENAGLIKE